MERLHFRCMDGGTCGDYKQWSGRSLHEIARDVGRGGG